ncbi:IPT/TIG domain-containing protein [Cognataquiflexum rubidum]|uniref:IPT/TIG domain-containing protein n=1 Tax=Cognataquiflexum rubidum TaxID=2922273 RepID=UPI001F14376D|nr:IPT/TIG domain-containing protein [Cognataquiflexum rubidum]MCH6232628.1 IPT/TIG domain-containing protein [Cognataquiflexum rubidum]
MKHIYPYIFLLCCLGFFSCDEKADGGFTIVTEEIVNVNGTRAIILGRILAFQNVAVQEHGFQFSLTADFSDPIEIKMGERSRPGNFVGETESLSLGKEYFVRGFAQTKSDLVFGNTLTLVTLKPSVERFFPITQFAGEIVTVFGRGFESTSEVFFGDTKAEVVDVEFGSQIRVRVPAKQGPNSIPLKVVTGSQTALAENLFRYPTGSYELLDIRLDLIRFRGNIYFQQGSKFFVGLGIDFRNNFYPEIYSFIPGESEWKPTNYPGLPKRKAVSTRTGFFGGGFQNLGISATYSSDFWKYENGEYRQITSPSFRFADAIGAEIAGNFLAIGGLLEVGSLVREYNPLLGNWNNLPNLPYDVTGDMLNFTYQNKLYIIDKEKILWEHDPITASAVAKTVYPSPFIKTVSDFGGLAIVKGDKAYIGMYNSVREFWELDLKTFEWSAKNPFPGEIKAENTAIFEHEGQLYFLRSLLFADYTEFWRFDPDGL